MKKLFSDTRSVTFSVLTDDVKKAEQISMEVCPINEFSPQVTVDTKAYRTPNQSMDLKRRAVNFK